MNLNFGFLCDYALVSREGKLGLLGIFRTIGVSRLPATHSPVYLAFELELHYGEVGSTFPMRVEGRGPDGEVLFEMEGKLQAEGTASPTDRPRLQQILKIENLRLEKEGTHHVNVYVSGEIKHQIEFEVRRISEPEATSSAGP